VETQAWTPHVLVMDIPQDTHHISFSFHMRGQGNGVVWLDRIELETVDDSVSVTDTSIGSLLLQPFNLDFSHGLLFWQVKGEAVWHYERGIDTTATTAGSPCAFLKSISTEPTSPCTLRQMVRAQRYWGKSIRLSASIKTASAKRVRLFIKHWLGDGTSVEEVITGTTAWTEYHLMLPIAVDASALVFGVTLDGPGQLWLNNLQFHMEEGGF
jgi:hypothetical protein